MAASLTLAGETPAFAGDMRWRCVVTGAKTHMKCLENKKSPCKLSCLMDPADAWAWFGVLLEKKAP